jgi:glycosyltransferase involved in cell wall biosynthesis/SAM-dependent methyltransferase
MDKHLVTIGIPVYNGERYLERCLWSILQQTYKNLEIIVHDDRSTDRSREIIRKVALSDNRIKYTYHSEQRGAAANFNSTLNEARGTFFKWLAQDDLLDCTYIEKCVYLLSSNPTSVLSQSYIRDHGANIFFRGRINTLSKTLSSESSSRRFVSAYVSKVGSIAFYGLYKTDFLREVGGIRNFPGSDVALFNIACLIAPLKVVPEVLFDYHGIGYVRDKDSHRRFLTVRIARHSLPLGVAYLIENLRLMNQYAVSSIVILNCVTSVISFELLRCLVRLFQRAGQYIFGQSLTLELLHTCGLGNKCALPVEKTFEDAPIAVEWREESSSYCRCCEATTTVKTFIANDLVFPGSDSFRYHLCTVCKSISSATCPTNLEKYYPTTYAPHRALGMKHLVKSSIERVSFSGAVQFFKLGFLFAALFSEDAALKVFRSLKLVKQARILEVGCGTGALLEKIKHEGFNDLHGIDPYSNLDGLKLRGVSCQKCSISEVSGQFDLVILNHVIEHIYNVADLAIHLRRIMSKDALLLILTPNADSEAFRIFGTSWVQLDAPRHMTIFSPLALRKFFELRGFRLMSSEFNSSEFQIVGSLMGMRGVSLVSKHSLYSGRLVSRLKLYIKKLQYRKTSKEWNTAGVGDQGWWLFGRIDGDLQ